MSFKNKEIFKIPEEVSRVTNTLRKAGFEAFLIGGCTRDLILGKKPKDWDVTTNATPEEIIPLFEKTFYENNFGTVGIVNENTKDETLKVIEVTPYRLETKYSDNRRPDNVTFSKKIEDDLKRRDFTINALAYDDHKGQIIDLYKGQKDIKDKVVRTVGDPDDRFGEDALRMIRAIRIKSELGFTLNISTKKAIEKNSSLIKNISKERIRDEFIRIIESGNAMEALDISRETGLLKHIIPELTLSLGVKQNQAHSFDVWTHSLKSLECAEKKNFPFHVKLSALLHDIGKPKSRRWSDEKKDWTFYGHEVIGEKITRKTMRNLKFSKDITEKVTNLVRWHMFFSDTEKITHSAVRRIISKVGTENIWDLINVRICDRVGTGRPKENPYRLRKYKSMIEEVITDPISVKMLKINGNMIIEKTKIKPGKKVGYILHILLEEVMEDPKRNTEKYLEKRALELSKIKEIELEKIGENAKNKKDLEQEKKMADIRKKHWVN